MIAPLGAFHLVAALTALGCGTLVAAMAKGTARHRWLGRVYLGAMLALNLSALLIYRLTGHANLFHFFAVISLGSLLAGFVAVRRRRPGWRVQHARSMLWSYVGLLAAALSETAVRVPGLVHGWAGFRIAVTVATLLTMVAGALLIRRTVARLR